MKKKKIFAICDLEEAYVVRLADYLNQSGKLPYQVLAFTSLERLGAYAKENEIEILLISPDAMSDEVKGMRIKRVMILSDGEEPDLDRQQMQISKYQDSDSIARAVMDYAQEGAGALMPQDCRMIAVCSPVGRCGKTMFALTLAMLAAEEGRTMYLNLEGYSGFEPLFRTTYRSDTADLVYAAGEEEQNLAMLMESSVESFGSLDIVPPVFFPEDIRDISCRDWKTFLARASEAGAYKTIVLDAGMQVSGVTDLLEMCDRWYMPVLQDPVSRAKISQFDRNMEALGKEKLLSAMTRVYLPEVSVRNSQGALLDDLVYGRMGQFARALLKESARPAA